MKSLILVLMSVLVGLTACSLGKDTAEQNTDLIRQNKAVDDLYSPLVGTYKGTLHNYKIGDESVRLIIYISNVAVTNPDGTPGSKDVPRATFYRDDPVIADYAMDVKGYSVESGNLSFGNLGTDLSISAISAHLAGGNLTGTVNNSSQPIGTLDLQFESKNTGTPDDSEDRLYRRYQALQGLYEGYTSGAGRQRHLSVELTAFMNGHDVRLTGFYRNLDDPGNVDLGLTVTYRWDISPPQITMVGKGLDRYELDFSGTLENDVMVVSINSLAEGTYGIARLVKKVSEDELLRQYKMLAGSYTGNLATPDGKSTPVVLDLAASMVNRKAALTGKYTQAGDSKATTTFGLASMILSSGEIVMNGSTAAGSSRTLDGRIVNGVLTAELLHRQSHIGNLSLTKQ